MEAKTRRILRARGTRKTHSTGVRLNADAATAVLAPIYNSIATTKAAGQHNLNYGEVEWPTLKYIADTVQRTPGRGKFYDLGCGRGRAVLYMALLGIFEQSVGIEVLGERIKLAKDAMAQLAKTIGSADSKIRLYEASFTMPTFKFSDARAVYMSNLCFDDHTQSVIFQKLVREMPKDSLLFCHRVPSPIPAAFSVVAVERMPMTWTPTSEFHALRHL